MVHGSCCLENRKCLLYPHKALCILCTGLEASCDSYYFMQSESIMSSSLCHAVTTWCLLWYIGGYHGTLIRPPHYSDHVKLVPNIAKAYFMYDLINKTTSL